MPYPTDFKYTKEHEWIKVDGNSATVGITDHAQEALGDIVFVELPKPGAEITKGRPLARWSRSRRCRIYTLPLPVPSLR